jgi:hypothetical protein
MAVSQRLLDLLKSKFGGMPELQQELKSLLESPQEIDTDEIADGAITEDKLHDDVVAQLGGGAAESYVDVTISAADMLAIGDTPKVILAAASAGNINVIKGIYYSYEHVTTAYDVNTINALDVVNETSLTLITSITPTVSILTGTADFQGYQGAQGSHDPLAEGEDYVMTTDTATNPTLGDGVLKLRIFYRTVPVTL